MIDITLMVSIIINKIIEKKKLLTGSAYSWAATGLAFV